ncbi:phytoene/squalene synthase family protein [Nannocystis sp. ILAH1]|uniref:phytoene/squalene synthase family protein n=1 Tax=unclassified Nannocystis TaxID=2627009 RepID=UPI00226F09A5|nr:MULTISPECIES: phytoene/squalene synthase family protein [unclassified Nannocystis]MCY0993028.1 phytoene/squalene synthase family protein [Nannocystis sp. ILAH1]MCY1066139.1 phytoene/squalene synthase family protein [Nannocystis sp. RBIL2]
MSYDRVRVVAESRATLARHARTFDLAGWFLPAERLDEAAVVYAFCRLVDDVVDLAQAPGEGLAAVEAIEAELAGTAEARPLVACYRDLLAGWGVPLQVAHELIAGVRADAGPVALPDDAALLRYCYQVAGTVGLMMCGVIGARDPLASPFALDLGIAMQLTNIARDVAEDAARGRVYLPANRLDFAGTSPEALLAGTAGREAVAGVVLDVLALAERYYASADAGMRFIPWRTRLAIVVASRVYRAIGLRLRRRGGDALAGRTIVPALEKALWTGAALLGFLRGAIRPRQEPHDPQLHRFIADLPGADGGIRRPSRVTRGGRVLALVREVF